MKYVLFLTVCVICTGCVASRSSSSSGEELNPISDGHNFLDSLRAAGVDTFVTYFDGCSGCVEGWPQSYYIIWQQSGISYLTRFTEKGYYNVVESADFNWQFVEKHVDRLKTEELQHPEALFSHYHYDRVSVLLGNADVQYEVLGFEQEVNEMSLKVILIDKIRSYLFEIPVWEWK